MICFAAMFTVRGINAMRDLEEVTRYQIWYRRKNETSWGPLRFGIS